MSQKHWVIVGVIIALAMVIVTWVTYGLVMGEIERP